MRGEVFPLLVQSEGAFMKRKVATIFLAGVMVCMAGTVSYSVPVLMVRNDEQVAIPGSGMLTRCPFSFVETPPYDTCSSVGYRGLEAILRFMRMGLRPGGWCMTRQVVMPAGGTMT